MNRDKFNTSAHIVVGAGYGDEGKGSTVDHLCNTNPNPIVIRFSGGPQAGHTVQVGNKRHTHSNFGSGTFRNDTPTLFSEHALISPVTIERERIVLIHKGCSKPDLFVHPLAKIITPWDVYDNMKCNDNLNHGTCGHGIHKTMKRNETGPTLHAIDLMSNDILHPKIMAIKLYYQSMWFKSGVLFSISQWLEDEISEFFTALDNKEWTVRNYDILEDYNTLVFEGSQGILLDMDHGVFPHVTHANTTSKNAIDILDKIGWHNPSPIVYYVTRSYSTRHGNGPFTEQDITLRMDKGEEHNVSNKYQGNFKIARIDYTKLNYAISVDKLYSGNCATVLVVTCLDQQEDFDYMFLIHEFDMVIFSHHPDSVHFLEINP